MPINSGLCYKHNSALVYWKPNNNIQMIHILTIEYYRQAECNITSNRLCCSEISELEVVNLLRRQYQTDRRPDQQKFIQKLIFLNGGNITFLFPMVSFAMLWDINVILNFGLMDQHSWPFSPAASSFSFLSLRNIPYSWKGLCYFSWIIYLLDLCFWVIVL